jgi:hypothetical protein
MRYCARRYHTAVLLLAGWYLMLPQLKQRRADVNLPLRRWYFFNERKDPDWRYTKKYALVFETEAQCMQRISEQNHFLEKLDKVIHHDISDSIEIWRHALCVSSDDPRLK